jgi:HD superfamily phosphohydrolase
MERIIMCSALVKKEDGNVLSYRDKVIDDIIQALKGREMMYKSVYYHRSVVSASLLIEKAMNLAKDKLRIVDDLMCPEGFARITDCYIVQSILNYTGKNEKMNEAQECIKRVFVERKLPKMIKEVKAGTPSVKENTFSIPPSDTVKAEFFEKEGILVMLKDGTTVDFASALNEAKYYESGRGIKRYYEQV